MTLKQIMKEGQKIKIAVATKTEAWSRSEETARSQGLAVEEAVVKHQDPLPPGTATVISRWVYVRQAYY